MNFEPGQSVLCIAKGWIRVEFFDPPLICPRRGSIYVVERIEARYFGPHGWGDGLQVAGMPDEFWAAFGFVPLKKRQTNISVFTAMQNKYPAGRPVRTTPVKTPSEIVRAIRQRQERGNSDVL